jgi:hypothetical protein
VATVSSLLKLLILSEAAVADAFMNNTRARTHTSDICTVETVVRRLASRREDIQTRCLDAAIDYLCDRSFWPSSLTSSFLLHPLLMSRLSNPPRAAARRGTQGTDSMTASLLSH